jgi:lysozyme family protein
MYLMKASVLGEEKDKVKKKHCIKPHRNPNVLKIRVRLASCPRILQRESQKGVSWFSCTAHHETSKYET